MFILFMLIANILNILKTKQSCQEGYFISSAIPVGIDNLFIYTAVV